MGKRREEDQTVHLRLSPLKSVHTLVSVFHTLPPTPRAIFIQCNVHCRQWTHHNGHDALTGTEPCKAQTSHLSLLSAQGKSQHHLCFSGSEALLFISVHLGHSLSEPIVLFFSFFFCVVCLFLIKGVSSVFHCNYKWDSVILSSTSTTSGPNWSVHCFTVARMLRSRWSRASRWGSESTGEMGSCDIAVFKADFSTPFFR